MTTNQTREAVRYISCADTAKLVRKALKAEFPGVKFSVVSHTYSMGASINVRWTDGPRTSAVEAVAEQYSGAGFDGSIDLKTYNQHWLRPDGRVLLSRSEIGHSYGETKHFPRLTEDAELVHFAADGVHCSHEMSDETEAGLIRTLEAFTGQQYEANTRYEVSVCRDGGMLAHDSYRGDYGSSLIRQMFYFM